MEWYELRDLLNQGRLQVQKGQEEGGSGLDQDRPISIIYIQLRNFPSL
jgi:hypothetical protein